MTEIEFLAVGGFRVSRYKYLMPPHLRSNLTTLPSSPNGSHLESTGFFGLPCGAGRAIDECPQYEEALNRYHAKTIASGDEEYIDSDVRREYGMHHFDTHLFQYDPGNNSEFEPDGLSINSTELTTESYFPSKPVAIYVKGVVITASLGPISHAIKLINNASVPDEQEIACLTPIYSDNFSSNSSIRDFLSDFIKIEPAYLKT